jgi:hypothetical protein
MTQEEIKSSIAKIEANSAIPEKQKTLLLEKYKKMLSEATGKKPEPPAPAAKPAASKKAAAPKKKAEAPAKKAATPKPAASSSNEEYNCDDLIADIKSKKAKQKARAKEKAKEPKKTPATINKEAVEKVVTKVTAGVEKRIDTKKVSISEIEKLIDGAKEYLKTLEGILTKAKDAGIMAKGGDVSNEIYSNLASEAKSIKVGHCGCSGAKMAKGGKINGFIHADLAREIEKHKNAYKDDLRINTDELDEDDNLWFVIDVNDDSYSYANEYDRDHDHSLLLKKLGLPEDFGKGGQMESFDAWFSKNKEGDLAQDYRNYKGQLGSESKEDVLSFREWAKEQYESRYAKGGSTKNDIIEYSDGFKFKRVSEAYARANWEKKEIFAINLDDESERVIEDERTIDEYDDFGIELK